MIKKSLDFWQAVISDESSFAQFLYSGCVWVWRLPDQEFWMNLLQPTVKHSDFSIMVWGTIWYDGKSELVVCEGCINSAKYIKILKEGLLPIFARAHVNKNHHLFMEDDAPCHSAKNNTSLASRKWHTETVVAKSVTRYEPK